MPIEEPEGFFDLNQFLKGPEAHDLNPSLKPGPDGKIRWAGIEFHYHKPLAQPTPLGPQGLESVIKDSWSLMKFKIDPNVPPGKVYILNTKAIMTDINDPFNLISDTNTYQKEPLQEFRSQLFGGPFDGEKFEDEGLSLCVRQIMHHQESEPPRMIHWYYGLDWNSVRSDVTKIHEANYFALPRQYPCTHTPGWGDQYGAYDDVVEGELLD